MFRLYLIILYIIMSCVYTLAMDLNMDYSYGTVRLSQVVDANTTVFVSPSSWTFPNTSTAHTTSKTFTFTSTGFGDWEQAILTVTGAGFSEASRTCGANPFDLVSLASCTMTVQFAPVSAITYNGFVNYSAPNFPKRTVALTGTGKDTNPPTTPVISVTPGDTQNVIALTSGGVGATSFDLLWGLSAGSEPNTIASVSLPYTHTGRTNGTTYYYKLNAINANGTATSVEGSGTPNVNSELTGYQTQGSTSYTVGSELWGYKVSALPNHNGTLKSITVTVSASNSSARNFKLALYTNDAANNMPATLVANSVTTEASFTGGTTPTDVTLNVATGTPSITAGTQYWIVFQMKTLNTAFYHDASGGNVSYKNSITYDTWPTWGGTQSGGLAWKVGKAYFTYDY